MYALLASALLLVSCAQTPGAVLRGSIADAANDADHFEVVYSVVSTSKRSVPPERVEERVGSHFERICGRNCASTVEPLLELFYSAVPVECGEAGFQGVFKLLREGEPVASIYIAQNSRVVQFEGQCWLLDRPLNDILRTGVFVW